MRTPEYICKCIILFFMLGVVLTDPTSAELLPPGMSEMKGVVTAVDLKLNTVVVGGKVFMIKDNPELLNQLQTKKIKRSDIVRIFYRESNGQNILFSIYKYMVTAPE